LKALSIQPSDTVCCVTASGDRPLNLLIKDCKKILSIDLNPIQNHLLALKIQAMQQLAHEDYLTLTGASIEPYPIAFTDTIIEALPDDAKAYWTENKKMIENGVLYEGALEKFCFWLAIFLNLLFKKEIDLLFNASDIFEQQKAINLLLDRKLLKWMAKVILHPKLTKKYFSDPGLYAYVDSDITIHEHLIELIRSSLNVHLVKENPLLNLLFQGKVGNQALPPYLKKDGIKKIKSRLNKIEIVHANMIEFLESQPENSIDCFSFSDIASYMSCENFNRLIK